MGKIHTLPENLINQIAAGEVIDRPASVIKELVENSIDAGATKVKISVVNGGITEISVSDNASGIAEEDIENAFKKHATSKISSFEDLFNINTLGFRGEALASISSISKITLETKTPEMKVANKYKIENGKVVSKSITNRELGTTITIQDIFYNIPARKKFLKSTLTEKNHIIQEIYNVALLYHNIEFEVLIDNKLVLDLPKEDDIFTRYKKIFGIEFSEYFYISDSSDKNFIVNGYISLPEATSSKKGTEYIFVNGRNVKDQLIRKAINTAFSGFIPSSNYPNFFITINIQPKYVDVNVHPKKLEVKWEDTNFVFSKVMHSVKSSLERILRNSVRNSLSDIPSSSTSINQLEQSNYNEDVESSKPKFIYEPSEKYESNQIKPSGKKFESNVNTSGFSTPRSQQDTKDFIEFAKELLVHSSEETSDDLGYSKSFQVMQTYIILEYRDKIQVIDQHAAAERIKYDKLIASFQEKKLLETEDLLIPLKLDLNPSQIEVVTTLVGFLGKLGIEIEKFGFEYIIRAYPRDIFKSNLEDLIVEIVDDIIKTGEDFSKEEVIQRNLDKIIASMACHNSIRAGYSMSNEEIKWLVKDLMNTNSPFSCPHGRPIIWELSKIDLEKRFGRVK